MIRLVWLDRFLAFVFLVLILFIITMGWLINSEKKLSDTFAVDGMQKSIRDTRQPTVKPYNPAQASSTNARHMYEYMQDSQDNSVQGIVTVSSSKQNDNTGYQWAASHAVSDIGDCDVLASEYIDGCRNYVEVNRYVSEVEPSLSL